MGRCQFGRIRSSVDGQWGWLHSSVSAISALNLKMIKMANFVIFLLQ
jgi:hypothetical protein